MEVRFFAKEEKELLLDSISKLWAENHIYVRKPEVLEHLTLHTPYRQEFCGEENYSFMGMWHENRVVGLYGLIPEKANILGQESLASTDTIWRIDGESGANGFAFLQYIVENNIGFSVTLGLSWMAMAIYKGVGWYTFNDLPRWVVICDLQSALHDLLPKETHNCILPLAKVVNTIENYQIKINELKKESWDKFYYEQFAPKYIGIKRDYEFLHWRYIQSPILKYHVITIEDSLQNIHGLAVIRIESILNGQKKIGRILEFIALESLPSIELANAILRYDNEVIMWDFYCLSSLTSYGLEMVGFKRIPQWMDQIIMPTRFQPVDYEHMRINGAIYMSRKLKRKINPTIQQLYVTKGDADQDRAN